MEGLNCKNEKSNLKMQRPNMALTKHGFKTKNWSHLEKDQTVERRGKERRRGRRREEEEEKKREKPRLKVWNYMEF